MNHLEIKNFSLSIGRSASTINILKKINLTVSKGQFIGLAGESGCGKTSLGYSIMKLFGDYLKPKYSGKIDFQGQNILGLEKKQLQSIRGRKIAMIFQEPTAFLSPVLKLKKQICEPYLIHQLGNAAQAYDKAINLLKQMEFTNPEKMLSKYPHELSGGQLQRMMIAMALITDPEILIADEPTTALDVYTQLQIMKLLQWAQTNLETSILFISHNLSLLKKFCNQIHILYHGQIIESLTDESVFDNPNHPYSIAIMRCSHLDKNNNKIPTISGSPPSAKEKFEGCSFAPRCNKADDSCHIKVPKWKGNEKQKYLCLYNEKLVGS